MECPKCGKKMRGVSTNVTLTLPTIGKLGQEMLGAEVPVSVEAFACEKCGYVEFYATQSPFG